MQDIISRFNQLDLGKDQAAFEKWISSKNAMTTSKLSKYPCVDNTKAQENYQQWLLKKELIYKQDKKFKRVLDEQQQRKKQLEMELEEIMVQKRAEKMKLWKQEKDFKKQLELENTQKKQQEFNELQEKQKVKNQESVVKWKHSARPKVTMVKHPKPWVSIPIPMEPSDPVETAELLKDDKKTLISSVNPRNKKKKVRPEFVSPPGLYSEYSKYKKQCPNYVKKYGILVASGK